MIGEWTKLLMAGLTLVDVGENTTLGDGDVAQ